MSELALSEHEPRQIAQKAARPARIPRKVRHAIGLLASGECKNIKAAAERADLSREHLSRMLGRDHVQAYLTQRTRKTIAEGVLRAGARVLELIDASSEHVSLDASKHVLAIEGIKPADGSQVTVNVAVSPGYVIDMRDPRDQRVDTPSMLHPSQVIENAGTRQSSNVLNEKDGA